VGGAGWIAWGSAGELAGTEVKGREERMAVVGSGLAVGAGLAMGWAVQQPWVVETVKGLVGV